MEDDIEDVEDTEVAVRFDPELYPRSYRISLGWTLVILACGAVLTVGALFGLAYFSARPTGGAAVTGFLIALCTVFFCLGLYSVLCGLQYRVTLEADRIESVEPLRQYQLIKPGDTVCVPLRSGALKIAWYRVETCVE
jgi:hypothetical protein